MAVLLHWSGLYREDGNCFNFFDLRLIIIGLKAQRMSPGKTGGVAHSLAPRADSFFVQMLA